MRSLAVYFLSGNSRQLVRASLQVKLFLPLKANNSAKIHPDLYPKFFMYQTVVVLWVDPWVRITLNRSSSLYRMYVSVWYSVSRFRISRNGGVTAKSVRVVWRRGGVQPRDRAPTPREAQAPCPRGGTVSPGTWADYAPQHFPEIRCLSHTAAVHPRRG